MGSSEGIRSREYEDSIGESPGDFVSERDSYEKFDSWYLCACRMDENRLPVNLHNGLGEQNKWGG
jgi:hypothetical protein